MQSIAKDSGFDISVRIQSDACAAIGIARRREFGKIRHLDVEDLWVSRKSAAAVWTSQKVLGIENPTDMLTTYVAADLLNKMFGHIGMAHTDGRDSAA